MGGIELETVRVYNKLEQKRVFERGSERKGEREEKGTEGLCEE